MSTPKSRQMLIKQHDRARKVVLLSCTILSLCGIILCGYGYAATSTDLLISGEATMAATPDTFGITYMQEMTPAICAKVRVGTSEQLFDRRDHKTYWVAKMLDGNCWMTQNLAFDLDPNKPLTSVDSDIARNANGAVGSWTPPKKTETQVPAAIASPSRADTRSWNLGQYVTAVPLKTTPCSQIRTGQSPDVCADIQGVVNWSDNFVAQAGTWKGVSYDYITVDTSSRAYDAHYLIGNYYQWNAAAAGSGTNLPAVTSLATAKDAPSSICPANWRLPTGIVNAGTTGINYDRSKSYQRLLSAYGYPSSDHYEPASTIGVTAILTGEIEGYSQNYRKLPIALPPSASMGIDVGTIGGLGTTSVYWLPNAGTMGNAFAHNLVSNNANTYTATQGYTYTAATVRCVAR